MAHISPKMRSLRESVEQTCMWVPVLIVAGLAVWTYYAFVVALCGKCSDRVLCCVRWRLFLNLNDDWLRFLQK